MPTIREIVDRHLKITTETCPPVELPYEYPDIKEHVSQDIRTLAVAMGQALCQLDAILDIDICEAICECPPCPEETDTVRRLVEFSGIPFENIYVGDETAGTNWIGNIAINTRDYVKIFDPATGVKVAQLESNDDSVFDSQSGYGMAHHEARGEVWVSGFANPPGNPTYLVLRVHDAEAPFVLKAEHRYPQYGSGIAHAPIEICPLNGDVYVGIDRELSPSNARGAVIVVDAKNGAVKALRRPIDELIAWYWMVWDHHRQVMQIGDVHDRVWNIAPDLTASGLSGAIGGLLKGETGEPVCEGTYVRDSARIYLVPTRYHNVIAFPVDGAAQAVATASSWPASANDPGPSSGDPNWEYAATYAGTESDPKALFSFFSEKIPGHVVSRGTDTIVFSDPHKNGLVSIRKFDPDGFDRDFVTPYNPARSCHCVAQNKVSVVSYWDQEDNRWFMELLPLAEGADATIRNPKDESGQVVEDGGPFSEPEEEVPAPVDPTVPADPTTPESPVHEFERVTDPPVVLGAGAFCEAFGTATVRTGCNVRIDPTMIDATGSNNEHDIVAWKIDQDPATDPPWVYRHIRIGIDTDADGWARVVYRTNTGLAPGTGCGDFAPTDELVWYCRRHEETDDAEFGPLSNGVIATLKNPFGAYGP